VKTVTDKIVDASALAAVIFNETKREIAESRLTDAKLIAPSILPYEMASVYLKKLRAYPEEAPILINAFGAFERVPIVLQNINLAETVALARDHKLSLYDACYLWLAQMLGCELVTLDGDLQEAFDNTR
jgi:predicted nucleic acid-binding protein